MVVTSQDAARRDRHKATGTDGLLATKLYLPRLQSRFVTRARLIERLQLAANVGLVLVAAPAGFGKSTLLADWARRSDRRVAWLSLDPGDNDPARFWRHVAAALDTFRPGIGDAVGPLLGPPPPSSYQAFITALLNVLDPDDEIVLVLDDYDRIETAAVHDALAFMLEHRPPSLHLVMACRADPILPLARWRARAELVELRAADLRFTSDEAASLLRAIVDAPLSDAAIAALEERTEGWAAGLQLAALSLSTQSDAAQFVESFGASHRFVLDYLTDEVLKDQPEAVRTFLVKTSVLERLSGSLCDAVTGRTDGQTMLEAIERANLFLMPLDDVRGWWRYHHLFAELLRARLEHELPEERQEIHRAAAAWSDERGLADDAVSHALGAGDFAWAARLIERHAGARLLRGEGATLQRWIAALPGQLTESRPRLLLAKAYLALLSGDLNPFEAPLTEARAAIAAAPALADEAFEPFDGPGPSLIANIPASIALGLAHVAELRGDGDETRACAEQARALVHKDEWMLGILVEAHVALGALLTGRLDEAERALAVAVTRSKDVGERVLVARGWALQAQVQRASGRLDAAFATNRQALEVISPPGGPTVPGSGLMLVGMAEVAYERGDLDAALDYVTQGIALCRQLADAITGAPQPLANGLAILAWIRQASGDQRGAREAIEEAAAAAPPRSVTSLLNPVPAQRARLLLAQGDVEGAAQWIDELLLAADDEPSYHHEAEHLVLARVLLARDEVEPALALLARLHALASDQRRIRSLIEIQALRGLALARSGDELEAERSLADAARRAHPQGYVRVFVDEGTPMATLLARLIRARRSNASVGRGLPLAYLGRLRRSFEPAGQSGGDDPARIAPGLVEQLSQREVEVLGLLAAGKPNREIADELFVTVDTVKKHVTHIFEKLDATNRTEAVARARSHGLLA